jgi:hypothetical protein
MGTDAFPLFLEHLEQLANKVGKAKLPTFVSNSVAAKMGTDAFPLFLEQLEQLLEWMTVDELGMIMCSGVAARLGKAQSGMFLQGVIGLVALCKENGMEKSTILKQILRSSPLVGLVPEVCAHMKSDLAAAVAGCRGSYSHKKTYASWLRNLRTD